MTPLMVAVKNGVYDAVHLLLERGKGVVGSINWSDDRGWTAIGMRS